ncbi:unknown [Alistipes sp. CAG:831]|nr:unknown [Alistipes sp. CAG:831]
MSQFMGFQFKDDKSFHLVIIKYKVDVKISRIGHNMLLPFHKSESTAEFHDELLKVVNQCLFQF